MLFGEPLAQRMVQGLPNEIIVRIFSLLVYNQLFVRQAVEHDGLILECIFSFFREIAKLRDLPKPPKKYVDFLKRNKDLHIDIAFLIKLTFGSWTATTCPIQSSVSAGFEIYTEYIEIPMKLSEAPDMEYWDLPDWFDPNWALRIEFIENSTMISALRKEPVSHRLRRGQLLASLNDPFRCTIIHETNIDCVADIGFILRIDEFPYRVLTFNLLGELELYTFSVRATLMDINDILHTLRRERGVICRRFPVYVGNLPYQTTEMDLGHLVSIAGQVSSIRIVYDRETGYSKGFGFCDFVNEQARNYAIFKLNGALFHGRTLRVRAAKTIE